MYKKDLAVNNPHGLIAIKHNQTIIHSSSKKKIWVLSTFTITKIHFSAVKNLLDKDLQMTVKRIIFKILIKVTRFI